MWVIFAYYYKYLNALGQSVGWLLGTFIVILFTLFLDDAKTKHIVA